MRIITALTICILLASAFWSFAATKYFTNTTATGWSTAANWSPNGLPTSTDEVLISTNTAAVTTFTTAAAQNVAVENGKSLSISSGTLTLATGSGAGVLAIGGVGAGTFSISSTGTLIASNVVMSPGAGSSTIALTGAGTLNIGGGTGVITNGGGAGVSILEVDAVVGALGVSSVNVSQMKIGVNNVTGSLTINSGQSYTASTSVEVARAITGTAGTGTLNLNGGTLTTATLLFNTLQPGVVNNSVFNFNGGILNVSNIRRNYDGASQAFNWNDGTIANITTGNLTLTKDATVTNNLLMISLASTGTHAFNASSGRTITLQTSTTLQDKFGQSGTLTKAGLGTLTLNGVNTYTGNTTNSAGTLLLNNTNYSAVVEVLSGATLGGTGVLRTVTVDAGGVLAPGNAGIGKLTVTNLTLAATATNLFKFDAGLGNNDTVDVGGNLTLGGTIVATNVSVNPLAHGSYRLINYAGIKTGSFARLQFGGPVAGGVGLDGANPNQINLVVSNAVPIANANTLFWVKGWANKSISITNLLANDTDADGDTITLIGVDATSANGVSLATNTTSIQYNGALTNNDSFNYTISDGLGGTASALVTITVINNSNHLGGITLTATNATSMFYANNGMECYVMRATNVTFTAGISNFPSSLAPSNGLIQIADNFADLGSVPNWAFYRLMSGRNAPASVKKVYVLLFGGQSNALGWGYQQYLEDTGDPLRLPQADVEMFYEIAGNGLLAEDTLLPLQAGNSNTGVKPLPNEYPALTNAPISRFGPELSFARTVRDRITAPDAKVAVIKFAVGGTSLWNPTNWLADGTANYAADGNLYRIFQDVAWRGIAALQAKYPDYTVEVLGMGWVQGETDAMDGKGAEYQQHLTDFITDVRATFNTNLTFVLSKISPNQIANDTNPTNILNWPLVRAAQDAVASALPRVVATETLGTNYAVSTGLSEGQLHFKTSALLQIGRDLGNALGSASGF